MGWNYFYILGMKLFIHSAWSNLIQDSKRAPDALVIIMIIEAQNIWNFADYFLKCIFPREVPCIFIHIHSVQSNGLIDSISALVQAVACCQTLSHYLYQW